MDNYTNTFVVEDNAIISRPPKGLPFLQSKSYLFERGSRRPVSPPVATVATCELS